MRIAEKPGLGKQGKVAGVAIRKTRRIASNHGMRSGGRHWYCSSLRLLAGDRYAELSREQCRESIGKSKTANVFEGFDRVTV